MSALRVCLKISRHHKGWRSVCLPFKPTRRGGGYHPRKSTPKSIPCLMPFTTIVGNHVLSFFGHLEFLIWVSDKDRCPKSNPGKRKHGLRSWSPGDLILSHTHLGEHSTLWATSSRLTRSYDRKPLRKVLSCKFMSHFLMSRNLQRQLPVLSLSLRLLNRFK